MDTFDTRLQHRLERLSVAAPAASAPAIRRFMVGRQLAVVVFAAIVLIAVVAVAALPRVASPSLATLTFAGVEIAHDPSVAWSGSVPEATARQSALAKIHDLDPSVTNLTVVATRQVAGVRSVTNAAGDQQFTSTEPEDAWVFEIRGSSAKFARATALVLVDAHSGRVLAASLGQPNAAPTGEGQARRLNVTRARIG